ncbi:Ca-activated chloride channel family protein [Kribbella aluminosa]|uniref:Ca-activated chloride channel family protein n=1 Tax=Kribbella aluminosa TaxID=416017 RepID=A0ABS4UGI9_9ACTN|nr:VWA domain-containing protein [Kribbella aluminosa]MBP2350725.1 Ca-activated chloride channel family protein [Kribbella aluminosa]
MTTHHRHRRPAVLALLAITLTALLAGLAAPTAQADPAPDNGKLVLVLDSSGSMKEPAGDGKTKIVAARTALTQVVSKLPAGAQVGLRVYGATVFKGSDPGACTDTQLTVPIGTGNRPQLQAAIAKYKPFGETPIGYSLQQAAKDLGPSGQRSIVLVSDGESTCAPDPCVVAKSIAKQGIDLKIDVIGFRVQGKARTDLQCVAREGRGDYYDADSTIDLEAGLGRLSTRAFRPFRISGTPVAGTAAPEDAPVVAPGLYSDSFDLLDQPKHYVIKRTMTGSTLRAGLSFRRPVGATSLVIQTELRLKTPDGEDCGRSFPRIQSGDQGFATGTASSWSKYDKQNKTCSEAEQLVLTVDPGKDFREIKDVPFELRIDEEPPVEETKSLPAEADDPIWSAMTVTTPREIVPGSSFPDAPLLQPGTYKTTLLPGELQIYKIKADWGQRIQAQATVPQLSKATGNIVGLRYLDTAVISPTGEEAFAVFPKKVPGGPGGKRGVLTGRGVTQAITTKEIRYLNRDGANNSDTGTSTPGEYYIVVSMTRKAEDTAFTIPMTLTVGVPGTPGAGKPQYVDGATPVSGESVTPTPSETPSASPTESADPGDSGDKTEAGGPVQGRADGDNGTPVALVAGLGGGGAVLLLVGALVVLRLRRKPVVAQPNAATWPGSQHPNQNGPHHPNGPQGPGGPQYPN